MFYPINTELLPTVLIHPGEIRETVDSILMESAQFGTRLEAKIEHSLAFEPGYEELSLTITVRRPIRKR